MHSSLQQKILKNIVDSVESNDTFSALPYSRFDKSEISLIRILFEMDAFIRNLNKNQIEEDWSLAVKSSVLKVSIKAQAQYVQLYMTDLFPDITKKSNFRKV